MKHCPKCGYRPEQSIHLKGTESATLKIITLACGKRVTPYTIEQKYHLVTERIEEVTCGKCLLTRVGRQLLAEAKRRAATG